jgi:hypothetical protein
MDAEIQQQLDRTSDEDLPRTLTGSGMPDLGEDLSRIRTATSYPDRQPNLKDAMEAGVEATRESASATIVTVQYAINTTTRKAKDALGTNE